MKGRVTVPTDSAFAEGTKIIIEKWGADAVRDCDGTELPDNARELAEKVYNTYFVVRGDNEWGRNHPEDAHRTFLMSERVTATEANVGINPMKGYFAQQITPDWAELPRWQVFDRTTGEEVSGWTADEKKGIVTIKNAKKFHEYTVNFLAKVLWHPTQIYNYLTNHWTCEKQLMYDPACPATAAYIKNHLSDWCKAHPETNVVRFTTFLYQFTLIFNEEGKEKYVDWFGYSLAANPAFLNLFEKEYGYTLTSEDFVDKGFYNSPFRLPSKRFQDFIDFVCRFVSETVRSLVDICHKNGKEAMMFLGDDWIGAEPYGKYFGNMNLDAVVGSVGGGVTVRMLSEIPHVKYREGRFLPYFFPDTFFEGNEANAIKELNRNWITARRAIMRKPLDRIGFGGYLSLAAAFPSFVERVGEICDELRTVYDVIANKQPYCVLKVGVLNAWGSLRSWMCHMVAHELWYQQIYSYQGILEALSGLPVEVVFLSFDDAKKGALQGLDAVINAGDAGTAFSGGEAWLDAELLSAVRSYVYEGGGFLGVGEPTAVFANGRFFQLADVLGVDEELGFTLSEDKYNLQRSAHPVTEGMTEFDYGEDKKNIYALAGTQVLDISFSNRFIRSVNAGEVKMAAKEYGAGRSFYVTGLPYSFSNARLLYKALCWTAKKDWRRAFSENENTECHYYPDSGKYAVVNNSEREQTTVFYDKNGKKKQLTLQGMQMLWLKERENRSR